MPQTHKSWSKAALENVMGRGLYAALRYHQLCHRFNKRPGFHIVFGHPRQSQGMRATSPQTRVALIKLAVNVDTGTLAAFCGSRYNRRRLATPAGACKSYYRAFSRFLPAP
jgi:hypothetical protein